MIITTDYSVAYSNLENVNDLDEKDLTLIIQINEIISVNIFDPDLYKCFHSEEI